MKKKGLADAERDSLLALWKETREFVEQAQESNKRRVQLESEIAAVPQILKSLQSKLEEVPKEQSGADESLDLTGLEAKVRNQAARIAELGSQMAGYGSKAEAEIQQKAELANELAKLQAELATMAVPDYPATTLAEKAQRAHLAAKRQAIEKRIATIQAEQQFLTATQELAGVRKQLTMRELAQLEKDAEESSARLEQMKIDAATAAKVDSEKQVERFQDVPVLNELAQENTRHADLSKELREKIVGVKNYEKKVEGQRVQTLEQRLSAQKRIELLESAGLKIDTKTGSLLRLQRSKLPTTRSLTRSLQSRIRDSTNARILLLEAKDELSLLPPDRSARVEKVMAQAIAEVESDVEEAEERKKISKEAVVNLLEQNEALMKSVIQDYTDYIRALDSANEATRKALKEVETYSFYLDKRLLWIASAPVLKASDVSVELSAYQTLFSSKGVGLWWDKLVEDARSYPLWYVLVAGFFLVLLLRRRSYKKALEAAGLEAEKRNCISILPTTKALWFTFFLVLPFPLLVGFLSYRIESPLGIKGGLQDCAFFLGMVGAFKTIARPRGLLTAHFGIDKKRAAHLLRHLRWFFCAMPALIILTSALPATPQYPQAGRLTFIALLIVALIFAHVLLKPSHGLIAQKGKSSFIPKAAYLIGVGIPLAFIIGTSLGYISSVKTVRMQTLVSIWMILTSLFVSKCFIRWILISKRKLRRQQVIAKYEASRAAKKKSKGGEGAVKELPSIEELERSAVDVVVVEEQTTRLVRVGIAVFVALGLWNIWSASTPALSILDSVTIWEGSGESVEKAPAAGAELTETLTGKKSEEEPKEADKTKETAMPADDRVSLQDLLGSLVILFLTYIAARNIPGLLELGLLNRLKLEPGGNYAITTVLRYLIVVIGLVVALDKIGITWSSVQWLAAAITLGIGFGLQEIFANFVAGIILLFERPIRLGDVVTVGDVSGKVTQIKIRATTIQQFDNRELVVPNKEFITGQLVNWTLKDSILRFEVNVGIAYGSDTEKAKSILFEIAKNHPQVLMDPSPQVLFTAFGASSLDFQLRGYVPNVEVLISSQSELHFLIDEAFREAEIEIAFPQTDIHIRSMPKAE
ncbi:MAG: mechanosensitive ion channel domain-containing protein [Verrucomicrobiaceae bacterium]